MQGCKERKRSIERRLIYRTRRGCANSEKTITRRKKMVRNCTCGIICTLQASGPGISITTAAGVAMESFDRV